MEESKPPVDKGKHYLIFTPFRYPPLQYGSRFGRIYEPSLWYGSLELKTAFKAYLSTNKGIDLTTAPFNEYTEKISNKSTYEYSQPLGTSMREENIEAFIFNSARTKEKANNIVTYTSEVFKKKNDQYIDNQQNWICFATKKLIEFTRLEILKKDRLSFSSVDFAN